MSLNSIIIINFDWSGTRGDITGHNGVGKKHEIRNCTSDDTAKDTVTESFGNMTTKQAGLLGTCAVLRSQWGIVIPVPVSLDNTPALPCNHIYHISNLIILSGLSFLPIRLTIFPSFNSSLYPLHSDKQLMFKEKREIK